MTTESTARLISDRRGVASVATVLRDELENTYTLRC